MPDGDSRRRRAFDAPPARKAPLNRRALQTRLPALPRAPQTGGSKLALKQDAEAARSALTMPPLKGDEFVN